MTNDKLKKDFLKAIKNDDIRSFKHLVAENMNYYDYEFSSFLKFSIFYNTKDIFKEILTHSWNIHNNVILGAIHHCLNKDKHTYVDILLNHKYVQIFNNQEQTPFLNMRDEYWNTSIQESLVSAALDNNKLAIKSMKSIVDFYSVDINPTILSTFFYSHYETALNSDKKMKSKYLTAYSFLLDKAEDSDIQEHISMISSNYDPFIIDSTNSFSEDIKTKPLFQFILDIQNEQRLRSYIDFISTLLEREVKPFNDYKHEGFLKNLLTFANGSLIKQNILQSKKFKNKNTIKI